MPYAFTYGCVYITSIVKRLWLMSSNVCTEVIIKTAIHFYGCVVMHENVNIVSPKDRYLPRLIWIHLHGLSCSNALFFLWRGFVMKHIAHDDVIKWKHFARYRPFVRGIHWSPVDSPHKGQWSGALKVSLICTVNKRLSKQSWGWWFETPSRWLWHHCNETIAGALGEVVGIPDIPNYIHRNLFYSPATKIMCLSIYLSVRKIVEKGMKGYSLSCQDTKNHW